MQKDVIIIGNGIAGIVLATLLQRKGISFVLLDRKRKPPYFSLGETLPPSAMPLLRNLKLLSVFEENAYRKTYGYHSMWGNNRVTDINFYHQNLYKFGLKINKQKTITALQKHLNQHSIQFDKGFSIAQYEIGYTVSFKNDDVDKKVNGKILVDATGRNRAVLQQLEIQNVAYDKLVAVSCHLPKIKHPKLTHEVYVESFKEGWGIVSAINDAENICTIYTHKGHEILQKLKTVSTWKSILSETVYLKDFLPESNAFKSKGGNANSSVASLTAGNNWLAIGDAAMSFDPLSSHGITNAIFTAAKASETIEHFINSQDAKAFAGYHQSIHTIFKQYLQSKNQLYQQEMRWKNEPFWEVFFS